MSTSRKQLLDDLAQDFRHALRGLRRAPGFGAAVITTLALGLGANAAMFGVVDRLVFRPYAYLRDPSTVHHLYTREWNRGILRTVSRSEYASYLDLQQWTKSFSQYAAFTHRTLAVGMGDASRERQVAIVSASFFNFFDAKPELGRFFTADEDVTPRGADVVVLGYSLWKSEFGGRDVRGEKLQVGNVGATIIGVAPEGFVGVNDAEPPALPPDYHVRRRAAGSALGNDVLQCVLLVVHGNHGSTEARSEHRSRSGRREPGCRQKLEQAPCDRA